jgi:hypothetical protein
MPKPVSRSELSASDLMILIYLTQCPALDLCSGESSMISPLTSGLCDDQPLAFACIEGEGPLSVCEFLPFDANFVDGTDRAS